MLKGTDVTKIIYLYLLERLNKVSFKTVSPKLMINWEHAKIINLSFRLDEQIIIQNYLSGL